MNIAQLRAVLKAGETLHREAGDSKAADGLAKFSNLLDGSGSAKVSDFVKRIEKVRKQGPPASKAPRRRRAKPRGTK